VRSDRIFYAQRLVLRGAKYRDERVWLSVSLDVCLHAYLRNHTSKFHEIFRECYSAVADIKIRPGSVLPPSELCKLVSK